MKISIFFKKLFLYTLWFFITFIIYSALVVFIFRWIDPPTSAFIQIKTTKGLFSNYSDFGHTWKSIDLVSPYFPLAVIAAEDQRFFDHSGFDFQQIQKALQDIERGKRFRGASTISQQTVKNIFLWEDQSIIRKGFEAYFTVLIELLWSKRRILEVYINYCELGHEIFGVEAASLKFFNKSSERLSPAEAALLATVLPRPSKRNPSGPSNYMLNRRDAIMRQMNNLGGRDLIEKNL